MIVYANLCRPDHPSNGIEKLMKQRLPDQAEYLYSVEDLKKRLQESIYDINAMVLHVGINTPMPELLEHQNDLRELNIILVINGAASTDQMAQMLKLYPRYMTFDASDDTIISMLEKRVNHCPIDRQGKPA